MADNRFFGAHIAANGNTPVKGGPGVLHSVSINTKGATGNTLMVYDGTDNTGKVLAVIDTTAQVQTLLYDIAVTVGIYAVMASGTAADATISYG